jgi:hypothetical protein
MSSVELVRVALAHLLECLPVRDFEKNDAETEECVVIDAGAEFLATCVDSRRVGSGSSGTCSDIDTGLGVIWVCCRLETRTEV